MYKRLLFLSFFISISALAQVDPNQVTIVRDTWGVPHIYAKTDQQVAYGLAYAHAEDNFKIIQENFLPCKQLVGRYSGAKGAAVDYAVSLLRVKELVEERFDKDLSPDFLKMLSGYVQGMNDYAKAHPKEVLIKSLFPLTVKDYMVTSVLSLCLFSGAESAFGKILNQSVDTLSFITPKGSNAFAIRSSKTENQETFININAHQPLDGAFAWYEAHVNSEEGWNVLGGLFPGGCTIFLGTNENLSWAHTFNFPDLVDIF